MLVKRIDVMQQRRRRSEREISFYVLPRRWLVVGMARWKLTRSRPSERGIRALIPKSAGIEYAL